MIALTFVSRKIDDVLQHHLFYAMRFAMYISPKITAYTLSNHVLEEHHISAHISATCSKANSTLVCCRRNVFNCPRKLKKLAYIALFRSKWEYASCVWNPYREKNINARVHDLSVRIIIRATVLLRCYNNIRRDENRSQSLHNLQNCE